VPFRGAFVGVGADLDGDLSVDQVSRRGREQQAHRVAMVDIATALEFIEQPV
jgi:hypothetical protein